MTRCEHCLVRFAAASGVLRCCCCLQAKLKTGKYYFERMLPMANAHYAAAAKPPSTVMSITDEEFDIGMNLPSLSGGGVGRAPVVAPPAAKEDERVAA